MEQIAPHTLLRLRALPALVVEAPLPEWAVAMLKRTPYVIVRRGPQADRIPVGLRGFQKSQRLAAFVSADNVEDAVTPQQALARLPQLDPVRAQLPAFQKLAQLHLLLHDYNWGIGGSLQFELVTGLPMARPVSDIDVIMARPANPLSQTEAGALVMSLQKIAGAHADIQVVHGQVGFSLEEFAQGRDRQIMMKTSTGPRLAIDPWHFEGDTQ